MRVGPKPKIWPPHNKRVTDTRRQERGHVERHSGESVMDTSGRAPAGVVEGGWVPVHGGAPGLDPGMGGVSSHTQVRGCPGDGGHRGRAHGHRGGSEHPHHLFPEDRGPSLVHTYSLDSAQWPKAHMRQKNVLWGSRGLVGWGAPR